MNIVDVVTLTEKKNTDLRKGGAAGNKKQKISLNQKSQVFLDLFHLVEKINIHIEIISPKKEKKRNLCTHMHFSRNKCNLWCFCLGILSCECNTGYLKTFLATLNFELL